MAKRDIWHGIVILSHQLNEPNTSSGSLREETMIRVWEAMLVPGMEQVMRPSEADPAEAHQDEAGGLPGVVLHLGSRQEGGAS